MPFFWTGMTYGQELKEVISQMQSTYSTIRDLEVEVEVKVYSNETSGNPMHTSRMTLKRQDDKVYYSMSEYTYLLTDKYLISVQEGMKQMLVQKVQKPKQVRLDAIKQYIPDVDSVLSLYDKVSLQKDKEGSLHIIGTQVGGLITEVDMEVDSTSYLLKSLRYRYNKEQSGMGYYVVVSYDKFDPHPVFGASDFDVSHFIQVGPDGKVAAQGRYKDYQVIIK